MRETLREVSPCNVIRPWKYFPLQDYQHAMEAADRRCKCSSQENTCFGVSFS